MNEIKCRNIACLLPSAGFARIYHTYDDGSTLDVDWPYCEFHLQRHYNTKRHISFVIDFFFTMEGFRERDSQSS